ncbi:unnamed protein product [Trichobilharzia regenti]|nr:unnamed protein product [Trichobilharzia regenti]
MIFSRGRVCSCLLLYAWLCLFLGYNSKLLYFQVKILVPNSTAGMIIGKGGSFIKELKDTTGVFIQVSQKSKELNLAERCVTVAGNSRFYLFMIDMHKSIGSQDVSNTYEFSVYR